MESELHVSEHLLGSVLTNARGDKRRIMAVWLEGSDNPAHRPAFIALTVDTETGDFQKVNLPNADWSKVLP